MSDYIISIHREIRSQGLIELCGCVIAGDREYPFACMAELDVILRSDHERRHRFVEPEHRFPTAACA